MDDTSKKGSRDDKRINPNQRWELRYWSNKFGVSQETLKDAINEVGGFAEDVEKYLNEHK